MKKVQKIGVTICQFKKTSYLCTRNRETMAG